MDTSKNTLPEVSDNTKKTSSMSKKKNAFTILMIVQIIFALVFATYGWVTNNQTPKVNETEIQVFKTNGLIMTLTENGTATDVVDLKEILTADGRSFDNFVIKQASSLTGGVGSFYTRQIVTLNNTSKLAYVKATSTAEDTSSNYEMAQYIEFKFFLETQDEARYVYIEPKRDELGTPLLDTTYEADHNVYQSESYITSNYLVNGTPNSYDTHKAVRMSVTFSTSSEELITDPTTIFGVIPEDDNTTSTKVQSSNTTYAVVRAGDLDDPDITKNEQKVRLFGDFAGDVTRMDTFLPISKNDNGSYNYELSPQQRIMVTIRIWLEGGSIYCVSNRLISDTVFQIKLQFGSIKVSSIGGN